MTPLTPAITELRLAVEQAEKRAERYLLCNGTDTSTPDLLGHLHDHRTEVAGDLADAMDRIAPDLGRRFMQALYPEIDITLEHDIGVLEATGSFGDMRL